MDNGKNRKARKAVHRDPDRGTYYCSGCGTRLPSSAGTAFRTILAEHARTCLAGESPRIAVHYDKKIRVGEIVAWRVWRVTHLPVMSGPFRKLGTDGIGVKPHHIAPGYVHALVSAHRPDVWIPGIPMEGDVNVFVHNDAGGAGIYAFDTVERAVKEAHHQDLMGCLRILGAVKLWGEVIEHEHGYRAQYGKPASLDRAIAPLVIFPPWFYGSPSPAQIMKELRETYRI
jgi:hypothetical protein